MKISKTHHLSIDKKAIFLFIIIFFSGDTFLFGTNSNETVLSMSRYFYILICACIIIKMAIERRHIQSKSIFLIYFTMLVLFVIISLIHQDNINKIIVKSVSMTIAAFLCMQWTFDEYAKAFYKVMYFISICAIIFTVLAYIYPGVVLKFPYVLNTSNHRIFTCGFAGIEEVSIGSAMVRTNGLFWEPGVFQMYLNIAIAFHLLFIKNKNRNYLIAYYIALFLTFSTTGFIVNAWLLCTYMIFYKGKVGEGLKKKIKRIIPIMILSIGISFVVLMTPVGEIIFGKFMKGSEQYGSTNVRLAGVVINTEIALQHPFIGIGMNKMESEFIRLSAASKLLRYWTRLNTNTLLYQFAAHGIPYGLLFTIGTFKFGKYFSDSRNAIISVSIFVMLILLYIGENLELSTLPYTIVFLGYAWKYNCRNNDLAKKLFIKDCKSHDLYF